MSRFVAWCATGALLVAAAPAAAGSTSFFLQGPNPADAFASTSDPSAVFAFQAADNFTVGTDTLLTSVRWWGNSDEFNLPGLENFTEFTLRVFTAQAALPDALLATITRPTAQTNPVDTGVNSFIGTDIYQQQIDFDAPLLLPAGDYFLSVTVSQYVDNQGAIWYWQQGNAGDDHLAFDAYDGNGWRPFGGDFDTAFELFTVPAPAPMPFAALAAVGVARRRPLRARAPRC